MKTNAPLKRSIAIVIAIMATNAAAQDENDEAGAYTAIYYAPGHPNIMGLAQGKPNADDAIADALQQCKENGGENCYQGLVYNKCGAVSELQMGNPTGNPIGWGPADTLQQALNMSMQRCNYFARSIALNRYEQDEALLSRARSSPCAVVYYHCTAWGPVDLGVSFGVPEDPSIVPPAAE